MKMLASTMSWLCLSGTAALAQTTLISIPGSLPDEGFGAAVEGLGDVDGDGVSDVTVGVPQAASGGVTPGVVRTFSGASGGLLWETPGALTKTSFGNALLAVDDVDGDGVRDLLARPGEAGLGLLSGSDGATLWLLYTHPFLGWGYLHAALGDLDGDGVGDYAVGSPISAKFEAYSGATNASLQTWTFAGLSCLALANAGDLDGDGVDDVLTCWVDVQQFATRKLVAFSGAQVLFELDPPADAVGWGARLAGAADLDGDGLPELAVSDPYHGGEAGRVTVYRGSDQGVHFEVGGAMGMRLGTQLVFVGDVDGDGVSDLACASGAQAGQTGALRVFSGATGALVLEVTGPGAEGFASSVAAVGDLDGDGANDVAFGWPGWSDAGGAKGQVQVLAGPCPTPVVYCTAQVSSQGCASEIGWSGSPKGLSGAPFVVGASQLVPAGGVGLAIYSLVGADALPVLGGTLCVQGPFARAPATPVAGSGACGGALAFDFGAHVQSGLDPALVPGAQVWAQVWSRDPGAPSGSNLSDALRFEL